MNIQTKQQFHSQIQILQAILDSHDVPIKTKKLEELVATTFDFKSENALYAAIPCLLENTPEKQQQFLKGLKQRFPQSRGLRLNPLEELTHYQRSYASTYNLNNNPVPSVVPRDQTYWYLTPKGWINHETKPYAKVILGGNVFKVVVKTKGDNYLNFGSSEVVWDSNISTLSSNDKMLSLENKYGDLPG